jgi:hypothetical protein
VASIVFLLYENARVAELGLRQMSERLDMTLGMRFVLYIVSFLDFGIDGGADDVVSCLWNMPIRDSSLPLFASSRLLNIVPKQTGEPKMPLLRKLVIVAAVDGLVLHAANGRSTSGSNNEASSIRIDYKTNKITALPTSASDSLDTNDVLEAYGLVGAFN